MCGGGSKKSTPAPAQPTYTYYPAQMGRTDQQQVAAAQPANPAISYGSELANGGAPAATPPATAGAG